MNAIITVVGKDKVGIIAGVCVALEKINVNILDISQTVLQNMFTMNMLVDIKNANVDYAKIVEALDKEGERLGVSIRIQKEEIFDAMHKI
ncbi:MAG: ACT domain-containing protein [Clostridia bacterium]|nr:ACT domain-containing protein [Clostridia bacterium]MBO5433452.1 ACT domain-containing protein [Clostridia bacterium]MBP3560180.1 ACT domain-containing protein [Clostridia bacterium]